MTKTVKPTITPPAQLLTDPETLGHFVRARRTQAGLGIHEAAAFCGVASGTIQKIERASGDVRLSSVLKICKMLGVQLDISAGDDPIIP